MEASKKSATERPKSYNLFTDKVMTPVEAAYVAAIIDGEGSIYGIKEKRPENRSGFRYSFTMVVAMTHLETIEKLRELTGNGRVFGGRPKKNPTHKPCFWISWSANQLRKLVPQIAPYMITKRPQADLLMKVLSLIGSRNNYGKACFHEQHEIYAELCALNKRGKGTDPGPQPFVRSHVVQPNRICDVEGCGKRHYARGFCKKHFYHLNAGHDPHAILPKPCKQCGEIIPAKKQSTAEFCSVPCKMRWHRAQGCYTQEEQAKTRTPCTVEGCEKPSHAAGICRPHYMKMWHAKYGRTKSEFWQRQDAEAK